ncbi:transposase [Romeria aff. gracilis LEGE 07310]|uniref:Transposase n=1 Tax=Vasconcelosia minhoensis LEGE 07310 TaxID=915328 RepID=A0A8J7DF17_9CYAN|nr:transposase [Romeria gracilis]MBE9080303.1 transposase [Romeria aff. gracilis LEGE 07310]
MLAFMHRRGRLESYVSEQSITSAVVILCIDTFFAVVDKPTVIVLDQASIHTSGAVQAKLDEWKERGVYLFELPTYSPELNLAEILWRFMKYEWMEFRAYESYQNLREEVERMLCGFGEEFVINFA